MNSASGIVPLTADETGRIERLPKEEVQLSAPVRVVARIEGENVARRPFEALPNNYGVQPKLPSLIAGTLNS